MDLLGTFLSTIGVLLPIANPPNAAAVFYSLTKDQTTKSNNITAAKMAAYVTILLVIILVGGNWIIGLLHIPASAIQITGGSVLAYVGWKLINNSNSLLSPKSQNKKTAIPQKQKIILFPLATPVIVGPGCIVSTLAIAVKSQQHSVAGLIMTELFVALGIAVVAITIAICCMYSGILIKKLGDFWSKIFVKVAALTNIAIGIHIIWSGLHNLMY